MIKTIGRAAAFWTLLSVPVVAIATGASAQAPTDAQRAAIKSQCRSDYIAHCASVPPGGVESLQCLQKNVASLAPGCQAAVRAVAAPSEAKSDAKPDPKPETKAEPKAEPTATSEPKAQPTTQTKAEPAAPAMAKPAAATAATAPVPKSAAKAAKGPDGTQVAAVRSACRSDYPKVCAGVPTGGAPALQCLEKNKSKVSPACQKAVAAVSGGTAAPAGAAPAAGANASPSPAAAPAAPAAPAVIVLRPMRPREVLFVMRSACGADVRALCAGVDPGGGRIMQCLATNATSLSSQCRGVLSQFAAQ